MVLKWFLSWGSSIIPFKKKQTKFIMRAGSLSLKRNFDSYDSDSRCNFKVSNLDGVTNDLVLDLYGKTVIEWFLLAARLLVFS